MYFDQGAVEVSLPAATGVWMVNTASCLPLQERRPGRGRCRRPSPRGRAPAAGRRNALRSGAGRRDPSSPSAHAADPQDQLWQRRISRPRTYRMWVGRSGPVLAGRSVSSSRTGTRPTCATHTAAWTWRWEVDADLQRRAVGGARSAQGQHRRIEVRLRVLLMPIGIDLLAEVAAAVQEARPMRAGPHRTPTCNGHRPARPGRRSRSASTRGSRTRRRSRRSAREARWPVGGDLLLTRVAAVAHVAVVLVQQSAGVDQELLVGGGDFPAGRHPCRPAPRSGCGGGPRPPDRAVRRGRRHAASSSPQVVGEVVQALEPTGQVEVVSESVGTRSVVPGELLMEVRSYSMPRSRQAGLRYRTRDGRLFGQGRRSRPWHPGTACVGAACARRAGGRAGRSGRHDRLPPAEERSVVGGAFAGGFTRRRVDRPEGKRKRGIGRAEPLPRAADRVS